MHKLGHIIRRGTLAAALLVAASACHSSNPASQLPVGPLAQGEVSSLGRGGHIGVTEASPAQRQATYTVDDILATTLTKPIRINSITLVRLHHAKLIEAYVIANGDGQVGVGRGFPPEDLGQNPTEQAAWRRRVPSHGVSLRPGIEYDLIVGMRLTAHATNGSAAYALIDYTQAGKHYRFGTPLGIRLEAPAELHQ